MRESSATTIPLGQRRGRLSLRVLGGWAASLESGVSLDGLGRKPRALLAYLALHAGRPQTRAKLTTLLWGDHEDQLAGQSLRRALYLIRRALGTGADDVLSAETDTVALSATALDVDALEFERLATEDSAASLERAALLYRGELLEGFDLGSAGFEDWLRGERERLYELAVESLGRLLAHRLRAGQDDAALSIAVRLLALDPTQEAVHRAVMRLYDRLGRRAAALRQYQLCLDVLRRDLRAEPEAETTETYLAILQGLGGGTEGHGAGRRAARPVRRSASRGPAEIPLVGRAEEMRDLVAVLEKTAEGRGRMVLIGGEAGIGKTRLIAELDRVAAHRGFRVLQGHCYHSEQVLPFRPFIDALRGGGCLRDDGLLEALSPRRRAELARLFPELGEPPGAPVMSPAAHAQIFEVLAELLCRLAEREPLLLALEDIHWADDMSLRLLAFLSRRCGAHPLCLVATFREEDIEDAPGLRILLTETDRRPEVVRLTLAPLSRAETKELVRLLDSGPEGEAQASTRAARVWRASTGIPFVIVETVRELQDRPEGLEDVSQVPMRVRQLIEARLARLSDKSRQVLAVTAVAGEPVGFDLLVRAAGTSEGDTAQALERLVRRRIVQASGDRFEFCHEWVRAVAYDSLLLGLRRALHRSIGLALEALSGDSPQDVDDRLAHHFLQAGLTAKAVTCLARVAETARRRNALDGALGPLDRALALVDQLPAHERDRRRLGLTVKKGFILSMLKRYVELFDLLAPERERVEALHDPSVTAPYCFLLGVSCVPRGEMQRVAELARRAIENGTRCRDESTVGMSHFLLAWASSNLGRGFAEAAEHCRRATELLAGPEDAHYRGWSFYFLAQHLYVQGQFAAALDAAAQVATIAETCAAPQLEAIASIAGGILATMGECERAVRECTRLLERAVDRLTRTTALFWLGVAHLEGGDPDQAMPCLDEAIDGYRAMALTGNEARALALLGEAHLLTGDVDQARDAARRILALTGEALPSWASAWGARLLGRAAHAEGDFAAAERHLMEARQQFDALDARFECARSAFQLAELHHAAGRLDEARAALVEVHRLFSSLSVPIWEARADDLRRRLT